MRSDRISCKNNQALNIHREASQDEEGFTVWAVNSPGNSKKIGKMNQSKNNIKPRQTYIIQLIFINAFLAFYYGLNVYDKLFGGYLVDRWRFIALILIFDIIVIVPLVSSIKSKDLPILFTCMLSIFLHNIILGFIDWVPYGPFFISIVSFVIFILYFLSRRNLT